MTVAPPPWVPLADRPTPPARPFVPTPVATHGDAYAAEALAREAADVAATTEGSRNDVLNRAAFNLGQLVAGGVLEHETVVRTLTAAGRSAGLTEREISRTLASGFRAAEGSPRGVPPLQATSVEKLVRFVASGGPPENAGGRLVYACRTIAGGADQDADVRVLIRAAVAAGMSLVDAAEAAHRGLRRPAGEGSR